jgi:hypothetical protein
MPPTEIFTSGCTLFFKMRSTKRAPGTLRLSTLSCVTPPDHFEDSSYLEYTIASIYDRHLLCDEGLHIKPEVHLTVEEMGVLLIVP